MGTCCGDTYDENERNENTKSTVIICKDFINDIENEQNIDIYQVCAATRKISSDTGVKYLYLIKALVCFAFQTTMITFMVYQHTYDKIKA